MNNHGKLRFYGVLWGLIGGFIRLLYVPVWLGKSKRCILGHLIGFGRANNDENTNKTKTKKKKKEKKRKEKNNNSKKKKNNNNNNSCRHPRNCVQKDRMLQVVSHVLRIRLDLIPRPASSCPVGVANPRQCALGNPHVSRNRPNINTRVHGAMWLPKIKTTPINYTHYILLLHLDGVQKVQTIWRPVKPAKDWQDSPSTWLVVNNPSWGLSHLSPISCLLRMVPKHQINLLAMDFPKDGFTHKNIEHHLQKIYLSKPSKDKWR